MVGVGEEVGQWYERPVLGEGKSGEDSVRARRSADRGSLNGARLQRGSTRDTFDDGLRSGGGVNLLEPEIGCLEEIAELDRGALTPT